MISVAARSPVNRQEARRPETTPPRAVSRAREPEPCGGAPILDLALCLILAVAVTGLLILAL